LALRSDAHPLVVHRAHVYVTKSGVTRQIRSVGFCCVALVLRSGPHSGHGTSAGDRLPASLASKPKSIAPLELTESRPSTM
jgi:hypothetical protein